MKLLEIIPGEETLPDVLCLYGRLRRAGFGQGHRLGQGHAQFRGQPHRRPGHGQNHAADAGRRIDHPEVDALFGPAMGRPKTAMFKTADLVGLDTLFHVAKNTYDLVPDDEARDDFVMPDFVGKMIEGKMLGKKTKVGFYKTDLTPEWKKIRTVIDPDAGACRIRQGGTALPGRRQGCQILAGKNESHRLR
jgi:3-hydroxyacyl-CoA dehydrogenase